MPNTLAIKIKEDRPRDVYLAILIDGQHTFDLSPECLEDTFLLPPGNSRPEAALFMKGDSDRMVSYGFCVELCCPSTFATISVNADTVHWTDIGERNSKGKMHGKNYEFDRKQYDAEIARCFQELRESGQI
jgi:hypothetical protein